MYLLFIIIIVVVVVVVICLISNGHRSLQPIFTTSEFRCLSFLVSGNMSYKVHSPPIVYLLPWLCVYQLAFVKVSQCQLVSNTSRTVLVR